MDPYMTTKEVAELLRVPESTVRYWRHIGEGPVSSKIRRHVLYKRDDVVAWFDAQATNRTA